MALAWCFEDEQTPAILNLLDRVMESGATAPLLWPLEALNGLFAAERRGRIDAARRAKLAGFLQDLPVRFDMATAEQAWDATAQWPSGFGLRFTIRRTWNWRSGGGCRGFAGSGASAGSDGDWGGGFGDWLMLFPPER